MNEREILTAINQQAGQNARPDFADLLARIEKDGGRSKAPCFIEAKRFSPAKAVGIAAGVAAVALLSGTVILSGGRAAEAPVEAPSAPAYDAAPEDSYCADSEYFLSMDSSAANTETSQPQNTEGENAADEKDGQVSDSDVSASDISGSDVSPSDEVE